MTSDAMTDFEAFYGRSKDACLRTTIAALGDSDAAVDALDEAFVRAWSRWGSVSDHPNPEAWVVRTAINVHHSWWRRARRQLPLTGDARSVVSDERPIDSTLLSAVQRLPRRQREVVALRLVLDLDTETTGRTLGIAAGTVTAHLHRALASLRRDLTQALEPKEQP